MRDVADAVFTLVGVFIAIGIPMWISWALVEMFGFWAPLAVIVLFSLLEAMS